MSAAPDTVLFAAISSIAALGNGPSGGHVGSILTIDSVAFTGVSSQPANLNGDFENWNTDTVYSLNGWYISYPNVTRTRDADSGAYALELTTANTTQNGVQQGQASTGYYPSHCNSCSEKGGHAYVIPASKKDTLRFSYKYAPVAHDTANIYVDFIHNGQSVSVGGGINLWKTNASYKDTAIAFDFGSQSVDTVIINISSSSHNNDTTGSQYASYVGSVLKVDNITFTSQKASLGIDNITATQGIKVYPNPANNQVSVDLTNVFGSLQKLALYDMSGRMISSQSYSGRLRNAVETIDIGNLSSGIYLIEATTGSGKFYQKIVKE